MEVSSTEQMKKGTIMLQTHIPYTTSPWYNYHILISVSRIEVYYKIVEFLKTIIIAVGGGGCGEITTCNCTF